MKRFYTTLFFALMLFSFSGCKLFIRKAAKHWSKKQVNMFLTKCEDQATTFLGEEKAKRYCDCAVDVVAERYPKFEDIEKVSVRELLKIAGDCK